MPKDLAIQLMGVIAMTLLQLIGVLILVGLVVWVVNHPAVPIDGRYKQLISIVAIVVTVIWLVGVFLGVGFTDIRVPTVR